MLAQDLTHPPNDISQFVHVGNISGALAHARRGGAHEGSLFAITAERLRRHIEVAWDDVYGGVFGTLRRMWTAMSGRQAKINYVRRNASKGSSRSSEHTGADWAREWFSRIYDWHDKDLPAQKHGFPLWDVSTDRRGTFVRTATRVENYHHPRHLMRNISASTASSARWENIGNGMKEKKSEYRSQESGKNAERNNTIRALSMRTE